jgi:hypothetical protein
MQTIDTHFSRQSDIITGRETIEKEEDLITQRPLDIDRGHVSNYGG